MVFDMMSLGRKHNLEKSCPVIVKEEVKPEEKEGKKDQVIQSK